MMIVAHYVASNSGKCETNGLLRPKEQEIISISRYFMLHV